MATARYAGSCTRCGGAIEPGDIVSFYNRPRPNVLAFAPSLAMARQGWPEGAAKVREITLPIVREMAAILQPSAGWGWDVTGAAYDVGEYLSGTPECWLAPTLDAVKPTVRIMLDNFTSAAVTSDAITMRGAAMTALAIALQAAGYVVQVSTVHGTRSSTRENHIVWSRVILTDDNGGPLDTDRLLFMLAHPTAKRRLILTYSCLTAGLTPSQALKETWHPMPAGYPCPWDAELIIPRMLTDDAQWANARSASAWVDETFRKLTRSAT